MTSGWAFLVARGRRQGHRARLVPDVLAERGLSGVIEDNRSQDTAAGRVTVVSRTHRIRPQDIGDERVLDEHGRPLDIIYGFACVEAAPDGVDEADLATALGQALATYRRFLADESGFTTEVSPPFPLRSTAAAPRAAAPRAAAQRAAARPRPVPALHHEKGSTMIDEPRPPRGFWHSMPGLITGIAGIVTAVGGILAILFQLGVIGGSDPTSTTPPPSQGNAAVASGAPRAAGGWANATAVMTANDGTTYRSRASTFRYCISAGAGVRFNDAQDIPFESMTLLEVLRSDVALSPGGRADVRITLANGSVLTGTIDAGCDFIMQAESGRVNLYPDKVEKIEFQRP
jgi:hypothetical protein